jgi:hypothetical protein
MARRCIHGNVAVLLLLLLVPVLLLQLGQAQHMHHDGLRIVSRRQRRQQPRRQLLPDWFCATIPFICEEEAIEEGELQCPDIVPLGNGTDEFDLDEFIAKSWFVQKQQVNGYQNETDLYCLVTTYVNRSDGYMDYYNYGNVDEVNGELPTIYDTVEGSGVLADWCAGQDRYGGGLLRISPCVLRPLLERVGIPHWVIAVADDYSWAIVSGGEPDTIRQTVPTILCSTKTNITNVFDTSGSGLWLLTRERTASNDTIAEMEQVLVDMGVYTGDLLYVEQEGCNYTNATIIE